MDGPPGGAVPAEMGLSKVGEGFNDNRTQTGIGVMQSYGCSSKGPFQALGEKAVDTCHTPRVLGYNAPELWVGTQMLSNGAEGSSKGTLRMY